MKEISLLLLSACLAAAQSGDEIRARYTKFEFRIPMRDGKHLFTAVYAPKDTSRAYPFLLNRTPYSVAPYGEDRYPGRLGPSEEFSKAGYIFVNQDVRGRYQSEGTFVEMTPHRDFKRSSADVDESSDTFDTIEWLLKNVPNNNGRAGIYGISYPGFYAAAGLIDAHPALKAASPQAPMIDLFLGDDAYHNGAFMLAANFGFYTSFREHKGPTQPERGERFDYGTPDGYDFYLRLGPLANADEKIFRFSNPYWTDLHRHTGYDEFWQSRNLQPHIRKVPPAVMTVGGWYDAEDVAGPAKVFRAIQRSGAPGLNMLVLGPWVHGGWAYGAGASLGSIPFDSKTAEFFREKIQFPFFEHFLKDQPAPAFPAAWVFETGRNQWRQFDAWPPKQAQPKSLHLSAGGRLSFSVSENPAAFDEYVADPNRPVPFTSFPTMGMAQTYMVDDQRLASRRPDVLVYQTDPLAADFTVAGPVRARLRVSTSGTDSDWVVKLIDVWPDDAPAPLPGFQQLVRGEPFRGKFYKSFERPEALPPNEFIGIDFAMPDILHTFRRGHRVMVQIQSSWFPLTDRNPQVFCDIPNAKPADFRPARQRVAHSSTLDVLALP